LVVVSVHLAVGPADSSRSLRRQLTQQMWFLVRRWHRQSSRRGVGPREPGRPIVLPGGFR
jgi:hypothetical protein